jgi:porphyrinogen peroxidase
VNPYFESIFIRKTPGSQLSALIPPEPIKLRPFRSGLDVFPVRMVNCCPADLHLGHAGGCKSEILQFDGNGRTMATDPIRAQPTAAADVASQAVSLPLTRAAIFLVVTINPSEENRSTVLSVCADLSALLRSVGFRDLDSALSCIMGFGSSAWDRLFGSPRPAELHPFREVRSGARHAVSTPGDLLFHIRSKRMDFCFELAMQIMARLGDAVTTVDEVHGFRYIDNRDLLGFVDGTENPTSSAAADAVFIGEEDSAFAGGSYVIVQKYLHKLDEWNKLPTEVQEKIIGRTKVSDIELDDSVKPTSAQMRSQ